MTSKELDTIVWNAFYFGVQVQAALDKQHPDGYKAVEFVQRIAESEETLREPSEFVTGLHPEVAEIVRDSATQGIREDRDLAKQVVRGFVAQEPSDQ